SFRFPGGFDKPQLELIYIGLYLLIWGEASNVRFMPECICYIFHNMAYEVFGVLFHNIHPVSGEKYETAAPDDEAFLRNVICPIYQVIRKEARRNKSGKASHSQWRNYDDLNEYFWSKRCLRIKWPMDLKADFFVHSDEALPASERSNQGGSGRRKPKTNFVEVRTFWHLYRSFDRMWIFFILAFQPKLYVGRGMHEDLFTLLKYTLFWILLLISKLAFSYYVEILPLVEPTKLIMDMSIDNYQWHEFFPHAKHNIGVVVAIWAPIVLVYFMDAQIWYAIFSTIFGGISGAFSHLGEIRTLGMLRSRFGDVPSAFSNCLVPSSVTRGQQHLVDESAESQSIANFSHVWNEFINSMRLEDLISNDERDLLLVPSSSNDVSVIQWPPFLLASKIPIALDMAKDFKGTNGVDLFRRMDEYMRFAVVEFYETIRDIIYRLLQDDSDRMVIRQICYEVDVSIQQQKFLFEFRTSGLPMLSEKLEKFLHTLLSNYEDPDMFRAQIINILQDIIEIIVQDVMIRGREILERAHFTAGDDETVKKEQRFDKINIDLIRNKTWREKVVRLHLLLTTKESAINVPSNLDARRRITFFANSLFMNMPKAPKVRDMLSFSVLTPYYKEDVLYSEEELNHENEDGITILFYLQTIYRDEWRNFEERITGSPLKDKAELTRHWVSYRAQTLARTVRGMMYYRRALELQYLLEFAGENAIINGLPSTELSNEDKALCDRAQALADLKFTYVVSCQIYGAQKKSSDARERSCYNNILNLMLKYPSLRVAYIDEREETVNGKQQKVYYSVLVKGGDKLDEEIYRIKLPGPPTEIGEGKPENQNHAIIFTRGEALQSIDMNQDNYFEEAFKMRNVLDEFVTPRRGSRKPTILGLREHIFTGSVSSLAWFMSNQETSFVTIGQRILANPLRVRFHYGHPDIFDRLFHITRGGISKASKIINLSEDVFAGFNSTSRGGYITHHEYIQVGKGRDVGMNQISQFEAKVANGNGEQTLSRDIYRLGRRFDFYRMLSFYFTTVGFYFSSMITVLTAYVFLYGRLYMVMSGVEAAIMTNPIIRESKALEQALATQSVFQLGLLLVMPMVMEIGLEKGFRSALGDFIIMQLQLASVFFTFQLGTKSHYYGRTILHGGSKYRATGRGFVVFHAKFAENYRLYSRSHFVKGLELMMLLVIYEVYGVSYRNSNLFLFISFSMWFLVSSWLFAPFVFNPSGFDWQKTVDDWTDWKRWMGNRGGIGIPPEKSWESWWDGEQEHLRYTNLRGRLMEIFLASRFFLYQYGIVYHLDISHRIKSLLVYGLSWVVMIAALLVFKMVSMGRRKFGTDFQLTFRILKALLFLGFLSVLTVLFVVCNLTISDLFASFLAFIPTGWALLLIGQAWRGVFKGIGLWDSIKELGRAYEYIMGMVILTPTAVLSWFPFVNEFQTRLLFNQAFSRGLQISMILQGRKDKDADADAAAKKDKP
ncbi:Callose synthase 7, partial [Linum perenne]